MDSLTRRSPGRFPRRWLFVAVGVVFLVSAGVSGSAIRSRRLATIGAAAEASRAAVAAARAADAANWAPDELLAAERLWREALTAQRMAETRWWRWPDVDGLTSAHRAANQAARQARAAATARRASVTESARALIEAADAAVAASEAWAARIHLGGGRRLLLARARSAVLEARVYERAGDPGSATVRARQATDLAGQVRDHAAEVAARYADGDTLARWQRWKADTIAWSRREGRAAIVVAKEDHTLTVYLRGEPVRTYKVDLGFNWIADKSHAGDGATPEGRYRVVSRKVNGASIYYKALLLDYPNAEDRAEFSRARRAGTVPNAVGIGSLIEIHGEGGRGRDWTKGCVALTNPDIDDLMTRVGIGTPVTIVGSDNYGAIAEFASQQRRSPADRQP